VAAGVAAAVPFQRAFGSVYQALAKVTSDVPAIKLSGNDTTLQAAAVNELADSLKGQLLMRGDAGYDEARTIWNAMHNRHPALIVRADDIQDVSNAVSFARENELLLAVKGGGHSFPGKSVCEGGLMIDLEEMKTVRVSELERRAHVGGGALLYDLDKASLDHGLVTTTGVVSHTGVGGLTLGGGFGRLNRKYGLTIDNLVSARMVTADGKIRHVSADEDPDLFWGIRGGGGNFGVVTDFEFALHPTELKMLGGTILWPVSAARDVLEFYADYSTELSDEMYVAPFMIAPPDTKGLIGMDVLYCGDPFRGEKELAALRAFGQPTEDGITMVDYLAYQTQFDGALAPGQRNYIKNGMVKEFTPGLIDAMIEGFALDPHTELFFHTAGGAVAQVSDSATAFPHREAVTMIGMGSTWTDAAEDKQRIGELKRRWALIEPHTGGFYTNLREETPSRTEQNFGPNYDRLVAVKNTYDPTNLFRLNANVKPTV
jgi:hypothetical protein